MKKKIDFFSVFIFFITILGSIFHSLRGIPNDTFYTIKIGEFISKHGIDLKDHYCIIDNLSYSYPHWLYDLIIYKVYNFSGFFGLYVFNIILYVFLVLLIYNILKYFTKNRFISFLVSYFCCRNLGFFMVSRAQEITIILFVLILFSIYKLVIENKKKYAIVTFFISVLIANLHCAVWPFIFVLFLPFFSEYFVLKLIDKFKDKIKIDNKIIEDKFILKKEINLKYLIVAFVGCVFSGVLTPIKLAPYTYLVKTMMGNSQSYILEHKAIELVNCPFQLSFLLLILLLLIFKTKFKFREAFMIGGLFYLSMSAERHMIFLATIGLIYIALIFNRFIVNNGSGTLNFVESKINKIYILCPILLLFLGYVIYDYNYNGQKFIPKSSYPVDAVKWMNINLNKNDIVLYNDYDIGSYLLFNDYKVFVDSRADLYTKEFNKNIYILDDSYNMEYDYLEEKYKFTHFVVHTNSKKYKMLLLDSRFNELYSDKFFSVFSVN